MRLPDDCAVFADRVAVGLESVSTDPSDLEPGGWWAVTATFEGEFRAYRFAELRDLRDFTLPIETAAVSSAAWVSSMTQAEYTRAVERIREHIAAGWVYQVNLCRVLQAPTPVAFDAVATYLRLCAGNPAPYSGMLRIVSAEPQTVLSASPELLVRRSGQRLVSGPIKGTAPTADTLLPKDRAENVMIVDLVRNDLSRIAVNGSVEVESLMRVESHPGLVHLVSDVGCDLRPGTTWADVWQAVLPAGSVSGAPKSSALHVIAELEPVPRGIYCGAFGWVDTDRQAAQVAVGIRTFWEATGTLRFGTGAGITWGSDPNREWEETELKAARLLAVLAGDAEDATPVG